MSSIMLVIKDGLANFFLYAIVAVFAQNVIFSRSLGITRLIKLVEDPTIDTIIFGSLLCVIQVISSVLGFFSNKLIGVELGVLRFAVRPAILLVCTIIAYFIVFFTIAFLYKQNNAKTIISVLPFATFNCCVLGTVLVTVTKNYTLLQTIAFAIGSAIGYVLATMLVTEGQRALKNRNIPQAFKGLPATLIYIGIIALAIYGFTGHMPVF